MPTVGRETFDAAVSRACLVSAAVGLACGSGNEVDQPFRLSAGRMLGPKNGSSTSDCRRLARLGDTTAAQGPR